MFETFRRHQKKMLAFLAIFAMIAFTLDLNLFKGRAPGRDNPLVVTLYDKPVFREALDNMRGERMRANKFVELLVNRRGVSPFGGYTTREMVDALILRHEADALKIPASPAMAKKWLYDLFGGKMPAEQFDSIYRENFASDVTDTTLLSEIADQIRLGYVASLPVNQQTSTITPLDIYTAYRDQAERVSAYAVPFKVADYLAKVAEPSASELKALYERGKDTPPSRGSAAAGFKLPHRVKIQYLSIDTPVLARALKAKLAESDLREAFDRRKGELVPPPELPENLFGAEKNMTPRLVDDFKAVRPTLEVLVADEKSREEIDRIFGEVKDDAMIPFSESYDKVVEDNKDADAAKTQPPTPGDLMPKAAARLKSQGFPVEYDATGLVDRVAAEAIPFLGSAHLGLSTSGDGRSFGETMFDPKDSLYDPIEMTDSFGRRYLLWKVEDAPARVPSFEECRSEVVAAAKVEAARPLARKAADALAEAARAKGGDVKAAAGPLPIVETDLATKNLSIPGLASRPSSLPKLPDAGPDLRSALFDLTPGRVAVAADEPASTYYVLGLKERQSVDANRLLDAASGPYLGISFETKRAGQLKAAEAWMATLRAKAGLKPSWKPADDADDRPPVATPAEADGI